ncbi:MAG TPA: hypothetical protein VJB14_07385, partial [Planctomycetota bacterium]|nr:hypothetical protein [Planctomycetota bacterium]
MSDDARTTTARALLSAAAVNLHANVAIVGSVVCTSSVPVFLRSLASSIDAWTANGLRYTFAALLYWPILFLAFRSGKFDPGLWRRALVPAAVAFAGQVLWALAPYYLQAPLIAFLA